MTILQNKVFFSEFRNIDNLTATAMQIDNDFYAVIDQLCSDISQLVIQIKEKTTVQSTSIYANLCFSLVSELRHMTGQRRANVIPLIAELTEKEDDNHDCANCGGGCKMKLASIISEIEDAQLRIRDMFYRLKKVSLPLYSELYYSDSYLKLRNEMTALELLVTELFYIEESILLLNIAAPQKKAHGIH